MTDRDPSPVRQATLAFLLLAAIVAGGIALGRYMYARMPAQDRSQNAGQAAPAPVMAPAGRTNERLFCAASHETGRCSCITPDGRRPEIPEAECRRRARQADTGNR